MRKIVTLASRLAFLFIGAIVVIAATAPYGSSHSSGFVWGNTSTPTSGSQFTKTPTRTRTPTPSRTPTKTKTPTRTPTIQASATLASTIPPLVILTTSPLPDGYIGTEYSAFMTSSGGQGPTPYKWSVVAGSLPSGLTMTSFYGVYSTLISGKPTTLGTQTFTVQVKDGAGHITTGVFSITINPPRPLVITNQSSTLAPGTVGTSYFASLFADGGVRPYTWAIVAGQLPPGLGLSGNLISGTPTTAGTYVFTARVTDSVGTQTSQQFSITIN